MSDVSSTDRPCSNTISEEICSRIVAEHHQAQEAARCAVKHAQRAGGLLIEAKEHIEHGKWTAWIHRNLPFSERTAQGYMRVARMLPTLAEGKAQRVAELPLRKALAELAHPSGEATESGQDAELLAMDGLRALHSMHTADALATANSEADLRAYYEQRGVRPELAEEAARIVWSRWMLKCALAGEAGDSDLASVCLRSFPVTWPSEKAVPPGCDLTNIEAILILNVGIDVLAPLSALGKEMAEEHTDRQGRGWAWAMRFVRGVVERGGYSGLECGFEA